MQPKFELIFRMSICLMPVSLPFRFLDWGRVIRISALSVCLSSTPARFQGTFLSVLNVSIYRWINCVLANCAGRGNQLKALHGRDCTGLA